MLHDAVGESGRVIGGDLTPGMLEQARRKIEKNGWSNVELVNSDAAQYEFPEKVEGIISTFAFTLVPEYDALVQKSARVLSPGGRFVLLDFKRPEGWPLWLVKLFVFLTSPFGVSLDLEDRHPWESVERYFERTGFRDLYFGAIYICTGSS